VVKVPVKLVTWDDIVTWASMLAGKIIESRWMPDIVVAIARGGYVPARLLCDHMGINDLVSLQVVHWPSSAQVAEKAYIKYPVAQMDLNGKRVLIVDDIVDTGDSVLIARDHVLSRWPKADVRTGALQWISTAAKFKPDYYAYEVKDWVWFMYPWNLTEDLSNFITRIMVEEYKASGKVNWSLLELTEKLSEWYGDEILKVPVSYLGKALANLERNGVVLRLREGNVDLIKLAKG
jgi:hypoxanthine phosphoribosyltransferase